jgi:periplasmic protein TonB
MKFLQDNIKYPQMARESGIQGTVYVTFVVERNGSVTDVKILRGIGGGCDEEAVRVVQNMPKWEPGKQRGKPVRVQFNMPIKFTLAG